MNMYQPMSYANPHLKAGPIQLHNAILINKTDLGVVQATRRGRHALYGLGGMWQDPIATMSILSNALGLRTSAQTSAQKTLQRSAMCSRTSIPSTIFSPPIIKVSHTAQPIKK